MGFSLLPLGCHRCAQSASVLTPPPQQDLILSKWGEKVWQQVVAQAKCPSDFVSNQPYDDALLYDMLTSASSILKIKFDELLEQAGYYFIVHTHNKEVRIANLNPSIPRLV